jgi:hypothetical protein
VCPTHGGSKVAVKAAAQRRLAEQEAETMASRMDLGPVENPLLELKKLASRALAWEALFEEKRQHIADWRYTNGAGEQLRAEVAIVERAMDRCATILGLIAKLNLDERIVHIEEAKAALVEQLVLAVFKDLNLTEDQMREGRVSLGRRLRAITA